MFADLHSDLLSYCIHKPGRTPYERAALNSHPQLVAGQVKLQILAIFTEEGQPGENQIACFQSLLKDHPHSFARFRKGASFSSDLVHILPAIENASAVAREDEPLERSLQRMQKTYDAINPIAYISLTWNGENRFGGGTGSDKGLKEDGKRFLEWMNGKRIALDLSHASDKLAHESIEWIDRMKWDIPLIASHSNFRAVQNVERNLPDDLAKEIIRRNGLIGLNLFAPFIGAPETLVRHVEHALKLGAHNALSFGADFFNISDFEDILIRYGHERVFFFPEYPDAACYPSILQLLANKLSPPLETLQNIACVNIVRFLESCIL